jgi:Uma2 family endonuclease
LLECSRFEGKTMASTTATTTETRYIGPEDHGQPATLEEFIAAEFEGGFSYELARGVIEVTEIPGPNHGRIVRRLARLFIHYEDQHPGVITYSAGAGECRIRLPGMVCDRHPDQAVYLDPQPTGPSPWTRWIPHLVVEIVSAGGEERDNVAKREEYLRAGIREYWIIDPATGELRVLSRAGDVWAETVVSGSATYNPPLLPGLSVSVDELLGSQV